MANHYLRNILTVDTGDNTAIAQWLGHKFPFVSDITCPVWKIKEQNEQLKYMWLAFKNELTNIKICKVYLEGTNVYRNSLKSMTAATRGNLTKLDYLIGGYANICCQMNIDFEIITAQQWKGQMSKEATAAKVKLLNNKTYETEHITDAVAMGFGIMGMLNWRIEK
jgi:hypothetical protein